ncbi:MAG: ABC transporter permease, partial [Dehalococcoidia bacterium]
MMLQYATHRILLFIPTILLATMLVFALFWIIPGDAAMMILTGDEGDGGRVGNDELEALRHELGLDRPIHIQYGTWVWDLLRGDMGTSLWYRDSVADELKGRFPITLELAVVAMLMAIVAAVPLGIISAVKQDSALDYASRIFALIGIAMPSFWIAILMIWALAYTFGWL